ncbi:acyl carrier protein [Umezawaea sp. Da 62-37]|uniref:acyl carrier protein n=1 Tax=Umezawaea sp. Da 62-37 TaxID=3075927 RepID=UPI0028F6FF4C|nr:acyl carrier protein [Umezawaea sp. Da 62-37]WNV85128.1 acyl carrier protein [Umezawaea sp. Da 62-37]
MPSREELTGRVAAAVGAVLGVPDSATRTTPTLFDLPGFDSLAVVAVLDRLESELDVEVPADLIVPEAFESLESLTDLLAAATATPMTEATP